MKETGVVRKLDNLGRLVIPKEIRRCMRIKEGSPIEFGLLPSGEIVLCKYSLVGQISDYAQDFCDVIGEIFDGIILIGDRDKVIACHGCKKQFIGAKLTDGVLDIMDGKNSYIASLDNGTSIIGVIDGIDECRSEIIYPISIQGESEGVIILLQNNTSTVLDMSYIMSLRVIAKFLSLQME